MTDPTSPPADRGRGHPVVREIALALRRQPRALSAVAAWSALAALPTALSGWVIAHALDDGFLAGDWFGGFLWALPLVAAGIVADVATGRTGPAIGRVVDPFRDRMVERVVGSAVAEAANSPLPPQPAEALARLGPQVDGAYAAMSASIGWALNLILSAVLIATGQALLSVEALLLVLPPMLLCVVAYATLLPGICRRQRGLIAGVTDLTHSAATTFDGLRDIRAAGAGSWAERECLRQIQAQQRAGLRVVNANAARSLLVAGTTTYCFAALLLAGPALIRDGMAPGEFVGTMTYVTGSVVGLLSTLVNGMNQSVVPLWITLERVLRETTPATPEVHTTDGHAHAPREPQAPTEAVALRGVTFAYGPHSAPVLWDLNLDVRAGEHLTILGASGIGKSTLVNLVAGMLRPDSGTVRVGGVDPAALAPEDRAALRVLIPQEAYVFTDTLAANLRYLRPDADQSLLELACVEVGLEGLLARAGSFDCVIGPSVLTPAERQLVALTRSWLSPAPLVILDEATSALDAAAEERVERAFARRPGTLVVIAHRISSARRADRILVLDGTEPHLGTHEELLVVSAMYRDLVGHWSGPNLGGGSTDPRPLIK